MNRVHAVLLGSMLVASVSLGAGVSAATAAAPAGYTPGSPAGSEYQEQLATAREIGAHDRAQLRDDPARAGGPVPSSSAEAQGASASLFGAGITTGDAARAGRAGAANGDGAAATPRRGGVTDRAGAADRSAIAAAARAPLEGPSSALLTGLLVAAALLVAGLLAQLLRWRDTRSPS